MKDTKYVYHCLLCNRIIPDDEKALKEHEEKHKREIYIGSCKGFMIFKVDEGTKNECY